jgi:PRTRC genetic system protein E
MSMFTELYQLALGATLTMTVSADEKQGKLTINVIPKPKAESGEAALSTPLTLTAAPEEFDADFVAALAGFRVAHTSLAQQALVTKELLDAAKSASARKGTGAVARAAAKTPTPLSKPPRAAQDDDEADTEADEADVRSGDGEAPASSAAAATPQGGEPQLFG